MKKIKYGTVEFPDSNFDDDMVLERITLMLPVNLKKELKRLALTEKHEGKYQVLIRDVLIDYVAHQKSPKKKRA